MWPRDCSSDVCSSDLAGGEILDRRIRNRVGPGELAARPGAGGVAVLDRGERAEHGADRGAGGRNQMHEIGRASCRERVETAVEVVGGGDESVEREDEI